MNRRPSSLFLAALVIVLIHSHFVAGKSRFDSPAATAITLSVDDHKPGRMWRPLVYTAIAAQILFGSPSEWNSLRRSVDFYDEGWLIWLDSDTKIRELSGGTRSLDDFCKKFLGAPSTAPAVKTYGFEDVVATLNDVAPFD